MEIYGKMESETAVWAARPQVKKPRDVRPMEEQAEKTPPELLQIHIVRKP
ncbi:hypothetical protein F220043C3_50340 [Enterocloster asparagiformis]|uniref:Uncharacterized protein n=1 Tax=[Clostridium] asparagiforme DSM 15981 TaxID=518636 RepID=C0D881_9FIRM|nr:hypothetical protein [Enterocloster asparagiformis]EEG52468.1 hypothetical protein CLOSTASPAR_05479 [[Clostridium] asparagiforme DSM 15981]UWO77570.1 hypothetical protein NQ535_04580 [[Clostridium] asparagiforme DSM 15981]